MSSQYAANKAADAVEFAYNVIMTFAKDWPANKVTAMPAAHDKHLLWNIGHLATSNDWFFGLMTGEPGICPEAWQKVFGMGSQPADNPSQYPSLDEVMVKFKASVDRIAGELRKRTDAEMARPVVGDAHGLAKDRLDAALRAAWHMGWHLGQIANTRKGLGLAAAF